MEPMRGVVFALMSKLERDKQSLDLIPAEDGAYCEAFAVNIFNRANRVDRAGQANDSTAKTFYVASIFIDVRALLTAAADGAPLGTAQLRCCPGNRTGHLVRCKVAVVQILEAASVRSRTAVRGSFQQPALAHLLPLCTLQDQEPADPAPVRGAAGGPGGAAALRSLEGGRHTQGPARGAHARCWQPQRRRHGHPVLCRCGLCLEFWGVKCARPCERGAYPLLATPMAHGDCVLCRCAELCCCCCSWYW